MQAATEDLARSDRSLCASIEALLLLARLSLGLSDKAVEVLRGYLSPSANDAQGTEPGWEELTEASLGQLVRAVLTKDGDTKIGAQQVAEIQDTVRLKKVISATFDRIQKGAPLV